MQHFWLWGYLGHYWAGLMMVLTLLVLLSMMRVCLTNAANLLALEDHRIHDF